MSEIQPRGTCLSGPHSNWWIMLFIGRSPTARFCGGQMLGATHERPLQHIGVSHRFLEKVAIGQTFAALAADYGRE